MASTYRNEAGCLITTAGWNNRGYRRTTTPTGDDYVHRIVMAEKLGRPLLPGRAETVDHACHNRDKECAAGENCPHRACVDVEHFEVLDQTENWRRGRLGVQAMRRAKTHCPQDHPYEEGNLRTLKSGARACLICHRDRERRRRESHQEPR